MTDPKLRWQCRRGMRELDVLLTRYLDTAYESATDAEKAAFETLLSLPDPDLAGYLLQRERSDQAALEAVLERIRR